MILNVFFNEMEPKMPITHLKVKSKSYKPKTNLLMFARSKQTFVNGLPDRAIPLSELRREGKDVIKGVLINTPIPRVYGEFDYRREHPHQQKTISDTLLKIVKPKGAAIYDYSKRLTRMKQPLLRIHRLFRISTDTFDYMNDVVGLLKILIRNKGINAKYIYDTFHKADKDYIEINLNCYIGLGELTSPTSNSGVMLPKIKIRKVIYIENEETDGKKRDQYDYFIDSNLVRRVKTLLENLTIVKTFN